MNIKIEIDCEDERELYMHLSVIRSQIKKAFKKDESFEGELEDSNCYGYHHVLIEEEKHVSGYLAIPTSNPH